MTTLTRNGNGTSEEEQQCFSEEERRVYNKLTPYERKLFLHAKKNPSDELIYEDIEKIVGCSHGYAKNIVSKLVKKLGVIERVDRCKPAAFRMALSADSSVRSLTLHHHTDNCDRRVQFDFHKFIDSLEWEDLCKLHDMHLSFKVRGLYGLFRGGGVGKIVRRSKDIKLNTISWSRGRGAKVLVHRNDTVSVHIGCTNRPIAGSEGELVELKAFLGNVKIKLESMAKETAPAFKGSLPKVDDWVAEQWHYGRDSKYEVSGCSFHVTFKTLFGELNGRLYGHRHGKSAKVRAEIIQTPRKPLGEAISRLLNLTNLCEPAEGKRKSLGSGAPDEASDEGEGKNG